MNVKIFISSPGDVGAERDIAERVINKVGKEFQARWRLQAIRWDKDSEGVVLDARIPPQEAVNRKLPLPSECDIVLVVLWSRMGTPLDPSSKKKGDGSAYLSGTEWEYCNAQEERRPDGKPAIWVYHRDQPIPDDAANAADAGTQQKNLKLFLDRIRAGGGGGVNTYTTTDDFEAKLEGGLRKHLQGKHFVFNAPDQVDPARFVGRDDIVKELVKDLIDNNDRALVYLPGVGKTSLARAVAHHDELRGKFGGVLWADVGKDTDLWSELKRWATALEMSEEQLSNLATLDDWKRAVQEEIASRSNMLVVLDDIWRHDAGEQFRSLGDQCTYLMTTRDREIAQTLCDKVTNIEPLTPAHSRDLLKAIAPEAMAAAEERHGELLTTIINSLDGLPLAVELTGKYLKGKYRKESPERLERYLLEMQEAGAMFKSQDRKVEDWASIRLVRLLDTYYDSLANDDLRRGFRALSVFRPNPHAFSSDMARKICAVSDRQLEQLENAGLISLTTGGQYLMHRVINEYAYEKLSPEERIGLHTKALQDREDAINRIVDKIAGKDMLSYASWYRYENAEWQELQQARLYHLAAARPEGDWAVGQAILRIYFDAFWWWGYYQPFAFCDALIEHWQHRTESSKIKKILDTLRLFGKNYPDGYEKNGQSGWPEVKEALLSLRQDAELDGAVTDLAPEQQHIRGLMDFFLAEACAYAVNPDLPLAMQTYESARSTFEALGDKWNHSWILFYMSDLLKDMGALAGERAANSATARAGCEASIRLAEDMPLLQRDPEVLGNVYRVLGDIDFAAQSYAEAAKKYFRASAYAYAFQGIPIPPDTYTAEFYEEITGKVATRVTELLAVDALAGKQMLEALETAWAPYRDRETQGTPAATAGATPATADEIGACLFPVAPTEDEVRSKSAAYQDKVLATVDAAMFAPNPK